MTTRLTRGTINGNGLSVVSFAGASSDGTRVRFLSNEALLPTDTDTETDVYERTAGVTTLVSAGAINGNGAFGAYWDGASSDGTRVVFETEEPLVAADTDAAKDLYRRQGGSTFLVSSGVINGNGAFDAEYAGMSDDASRIFFDTDEQLVAADTDTSVDLYERSGGVTTLVSEGAINGNGPFHANFVGASADGTRVAFSTLEPLVAGDIDAVRDVYERSGGVTTRVSAGAINGNGAFDAFLRGMSSDGARMIFSTDESLVASDTDGETDIYQRFGGVTSVVSPGNGAFGGAFFAGASDDASAVFFATVEPTIVSDTDAALDLYGAYLAP